MLFNTASFAIFFAIVWLAARVLPAVARPALLLVASLLFYALWYPAYLLLLIGLVAANHLLLRGIAYSRWPRACLAVAIGLTLGVLASFKYAGMAIATALEIAPDLALTLPDIFLPLGISFYSFQIIGLAVDVYRGHARCPDSFWRYALFVSFFPQLIAGPILRGNELLPQLEAGGTPTPERTRRGLWLIASGLLKKSVMADFLLAPFVDDVFRPGSQAGVLAHWIGLYGFAFQIYFDFSGYTDMARGLACLLGFELPLNFREPYLSRDPSEFWRRWHITLSSWLRDYLYIPLGGNRGGSARTQANLVLTMLLGGLWHGAAWTFVAWGAIHGVLLVAHRALGRRNAPDRPLAAADLPRIAATFHAVCLGWVFFRAPDFDAALAYLARLFAGAGGEAWPIVPACVVALCAALHVVERAVRTNLPTLRDRLAASAAGAAIEGVALGLVVVLVLATGGAGGEFIYFQF